MKNNKFKFIFKKIISKYSKSDWPYISFRNPNSSLLNDSNETMKKN